MHANIQLAVLTRPVQLRLNTVPTFLAQVKGGPAGRGLDILTTKGDLITHDGGTQVRLPVGTDGTFLKANSAAVEGIEWDSVDAGDLPVAVPGATVDAGDGPAEGVALSFVRSDHQHGVSTGSAVGIDADTSNTEGTSTDLARADHTHDLPTAAPSSTGLANSEGVSPAIARADHVHVVALASLPAHVGTHEDGGSDELDVTGLSGVLADPQVPSVHASTHQDGGVDEISVSGLSGLLGDPQTPILHATTHEDGGTDEVSVLGLSGLLADAQTPLAHGVTHENGGVDEISVAGLSGLLADPQTPLGHAATHLPSGSDPIATAAAVTADGDTSNTEGVAESLARSDHTHSIPTAVPVGVGLANAEGVAAELARADHVHILPVGSIPAHASSHENGGSDEVSVAGLSGLLADAQTPLPHSSTHENGGSDEINVGGLSGLLADQQTPLPHASTHLPSGSDPITTATAVELTDSTNSEGVAESLARSDHTHSHGPRGGGTLHALVVPAGAAGFIGGADKSKLDGVEPGAKDDQTITAGAGLTGGGLGDVTLDVAANADGSVVVNPDDVQVGVLATDAQHGARGGGTQHAVVIPLGAAGFMTGSDKDDLDGLVSLSPFLELAGGTMSGAIDMGAQDITTAGDVEAETVRSGRATFAASTTTAVLGSVDVYACTDTSVARTLTVSTATIAEGTPTRPRSITVTDDSGAAGINNITIVTEGAQTIDGAASTAIIVGYGTTVLLSDGTNLTSVGSGGRTNSVDRVPVTVSPMTTVDVHTPADLPDAIVAPDGILRVPLALNTGYIVHSTFVWPRLLVPIAATAFDVTSIVSVTFAHRMLISGDSTPHIYGRNIALLIMRGMTIADISNLGAGRGTVLLDITGGSDDAAVVLQQNPILNFQRIGHIVDAVVPLPIPTLLNNLGGGLVSEFTDAFSPSGFPVVGANFNQGLGADAALKPAWAFVGPSSGVGINLGLGGINMNPSDPGFYIDPIFEGSLSVSNTGYSGTADGDFFRADVALGLTAESAADRAITAFSVDSRAIISVAPATVGSTFNAGARHNWRVGDTVTHSGFGIGAYNGTKAITSVQPFTYSASAVAFVGNDTGTSTHDLSTLVASAGHGLYRGQDVLLGGATPGAYAGLRTVIAVDDDEDGFSIPVAFSVGGTGTIQATRVTTASDHPMVRGEQHTITGTAAYDGTRVILATPADNQFDISVAFVGDEGATGTVGSSTLTEVDLPVRSLGNGAQKDSRSIGSVVATGNAVATTILVTNTWTDLNLGGLAIAGSNIERWGSVDVTTGEMTYIDTSDFSGEMRTSVSVTSQGANQGFQFRAVVNGSPLADGVVASVDLSNSPMISVSLIAPIQCSTSNTVRVQVQNTTGTSNVFVQDLSTIIS